MKRIAFLLVAVGLVVSIGLAATLALGEADSAADPAPSAGEGVSGDPRPSAATAEALQSVGYGLPNTPSPLRHSVQRHLWFYDDAWWGVLFTAETADHRIYRLDADSGTWASTGVVVDERSFAHMDVLWDGTSLVVASAGSQPSDRHALRVTRFSYVAESASYLRDADFPVQITPTGVDAVTVARGADARLWLAYRSGNRIEMNHTIDSDLAWRGPFVPEQADGVVAEVAVAVIGNHVALTWTRPADDALYVATHDVTGPPDQWVGLSSAPIPGLSLGDNDLSLAADPSPGAARLFVAVRIGLDTVESRERLDPQIMVVEVVPDAEPRVHLFGRVREQYGAPHVLVDGDARQLYVFVPVPRTGGSIYYKRTSLDEIAFPAGIGIPLMEATVEFPQLRHLTSTKQALDSSSGLLVAATDQSAGVYVFASLGVPRGNGSGAGPSDAPSLTAPLLDQTFDGVPVGADVAGWEVTGEPASPFTIAILSGADGSARLTATELPNRACARIGPVAEGILRIEAEGLFNLPTRAELFLLQVRGDTGEIASVRLREGQLVYPDGLDRIETDRVLQPGRWYRSEIQIDLASQTYEVEVRDAASGTALLNEKDLTWRSTDGSAVNRICIEVPAEVGLDLYVDNVRVTPVPVDG